MRSPPTTVLLLGFALAAGPAQRAASQLTCTPAHLTGGGELRITSPGAFGASPSGDVVLTYRNTTAGGSPARFPATRAWSASAVTFLFAVDVLTVGTYEVVLSSPAGALRNPACFRVDPALTAITTIRGSVPGVAHPTLTLARDTENLCFVPTTITLLGTRFSPGTEQPPPAGGFTDTSWIAGKTLAEVADESGATRGGARLLIRSDNLIEATTSQCVRFWTNAKIRLWFPDGSRSAWQRIDFTPGGGGDVLISR